VPWGDAIIGSGWRRALVVCALACVLPILAGAKTIDPQMGVEPAGDPDPFTGGVQFSPDAAGGGVQEFYNATGQTITSLTFTTFLTGTYTPQQQADLLASLSCNQADDPNVPNPFFLFCSTQFFAGNDLLEFKFFGTNPGTGIDTGIPVPLPGCVYFHDVPPSPGCTQGTFSISLNFGFSLTQDGGGWNTLNNPTFTASSVGLAPASAPEPASALFVGVALAVGAVVSVRRKRQGPPGRM